MTACTRNQQNQQSVIYEPCHREPLLGGVAIQAGGAVLRAEPAKVLPAKPVELPAEGWIASSLRSSR